VKLQDGEIHMKLRDLPNMRIVETVDKKNMNSMGGPMGDAYGGLRIARRS
jgi:hypothetical protein